MSDVMAPEVLASKLVDRTYHLWFSEREAAAAHLRRLAALEKQRVELGWPEPAGGEPRSSAERLAALERENMSLRDWISDLAENGACASDRATARTALEA